MFRDFNARPTLAAALMGLAALGGPGRADAGGYPDTGCRYAWVTTYVVREVPYTKVIIKYDYCGRPYRAETTCYETVRAPVRRRVLLCD